MTNDARHGPRGLPIREQEHCGDLDTGTRTIRVWMTCTCRAVIRRHQDN
jgi:hypothetical protein